VGSAPRAREQQSTACDAGGSRPLAGVRVRPAHAPRERGCRPSSPHSTSRLGNLHASVGGGEGALYITTAPSADACFESSLGYMEPGVGEKPHPIHTMLDEGFSTDTHFDISNNIP
jgi:hypothetical protein